jgi:hypothetical protein
MQKFHVCRPFWRVGDFSWSLNFFPRVLKKIEMAVDAKEIIVIV